MGWCHFKEISYDYGNFILDCECDAVQLDIVVESKVRTNYWQRGCNKFVVEYM